MRRTASVSTRHTSTNQVSDSVTDEISLAMGVFLVFLLIVMIIKLFLRHICLCPYITGHGGHLFCLLHTLSQPF